jgi:hypothetical protein
MIVAAPSRLQAGVKPTEAEWPAESPVFICLVSMLIGSTDLDDVRTLCRRLYERGTNILGRRSRSDMETMVE